MTDTSRTTETTPALRLHRLVGPLYRVVFEQKRQVHGYTLAMWVGVLPDADRKVGVVVSKRSFRRAVDRNRAKRLLREAFRLTRPKLVEGVSVILVARANIAGQKCQDVMRDLRRTCRRAKILKTDTDGAK
jgi:ribonuclease P protein component